MSTGEAIQNVAILFGLLGFFYLVARIANRFGSAHSASLLSPLAPLVKGHVDRKAGVLRGTYEGRRVVVSHFPKQAVGSPTDDANQRINAAIVTIHDLPGKHAWSLTFQPTGTFGQGPKQLVIESRDSELATRILESGIVDAVAQVTSPTQNYVVVRYEPLTKSLDYVDDVQPRKVPSAELLSAHLAIAARLAAVNEAVNPL